MRENDGVTRIDLEIPIARQHHFQQRVHTVRAADSAAKSLGLAKLYNDVKKAREVTGRFPIRAFDDFQIHLSSEYLSDEERILRARTSRTEHRAKINRAPQTECVRLNITR